MQLLPKYTYGNNIDEHGNIKTNKPDTFYLNMLQRLIEQFWINMLLFEAYLFITRWKIWENSTKTINSK